MKFILTIIMLFAILSCSQNEELKNEETQNSNLNETQLTTANALELGDKIAKETQSVLLHNVSSAMQSGGKQFAVEFCSTKAVPLVDSLSKVHNCQISRISEKNRNPANYPFNENDLTQLKLLSQKTGEDKMNANVIDENGKLVYYKPIYLGVAACLTCHGKVGENIDEEFRNKILEKYPQDKAVDYEMGDFRGAWKIVFNK